MRSQGTGEAGLSVATATKVQVGICCNAPENGAFTGIVESIEFQGHGVDSVLSLQGYCRISPELGLSVRIGRHKYAITRWSEWVGSWCWDQLAMTDAEAARLLNNLRKSGRWDREHGHTWAFEKWSAGEEFTAEDFELDAHSDEEL